MGCLMKSCAIAGCEAAVFCRGWCQRHYSLWRANGHPSAKPPVEKNCQRCGCGILAIRASKRFCDSCLMDHRKPAREQSRSSRAHKLRKLGLTLEVYDAMVEARGGLCDICAKTPANQGGSLCVDHDHRTGKIRGLLCSPCNRAIGLLGDSASDLGNAFRYLSEHERVLGGTKALERVI
jgi:Recombination endonuclease VII